MITYPLNNIDYTAEDAELYFSIRESGVYDGNDFEVTASGIDNDVIVGSGIAWIHNTKFSGKVVALKEPKTLTLSLPNSVYDRIDAIVIQFDANKNATEIIVKEGIASSSPIAPTVVRTESLYELHIFHVQRKAGATVISIDDLVDLRNDSDYCGIMFEPISSIDSTLTKSGYAADAAETGKQIKKATNVRNLLDNSDFTNPVNQRGQSSYSGTGYAIDRWRTWNSSDGLKVNDGYITITGSNYVQYISGYGEGVYSAFAKRTDGTIISLKTDYESANDFRYVSLPAGSYIWAALYEGEYTVDTLPEYVYKGYAAELLECQRYYLYGVGGGTVGRFIASENRFFLFIPTPITMRTTPTVEVIQYDNVVMNHQGTDHVIAITGISSVTIRDNGVCVWFDTASNPATHGIASTFDTKISFNADL